MYGRAFSSDMVKDAYFCVSVVRSVEGWKLVDLNSGSEEDGEVNKGNDERIVELDIVDESRENAIWRVEKTASMLLVTG